MITGDELYVFTETPIGNFSVSICFDYLSPKDLIKLRGIIGTLFVITLNPDAGSYHDKAKADAYSYLYGFICVANAFDPDSKPKIIPGRSGSYGPFRETRTIFRFDKRKYGMRIIELPLKDLYLARIGKEIPTIKAIPADFENISLARDYPQEDVTDISNTILKKLKDVERISPQRGKEYYEEINKTLFPKI